MQRYGIYDKFLKWMEAFLMGRRQQIIVKYLKVGSSSQWYTPGQSHGSSPVHKWHAWGHKVCRTNVLTNLLEPAYWKRPRGTSTRFGQPVSWSERWQLSFNAGKCNYKLLHVSNNKSDYTYSMSYQEGRSELETTVLEQDLGINIDPLLKFTQNT